MAERRLAPHQASVQELEDLRAAVARNLADAEIDALSTENRFGIAYEAALLIARMVIAWAGYRVKGQGAHYTHFLVLPLSDGARSPRHRILLRPLPQEEKYPELRGDRSCHGH